MQLKALHRVAHVHVWLGLLLLWCACAPRARAPITQNRGLAGFEVVARYPSARDEVLLVTAQQFITAHRETEGYAYFHELRAAQPERALLAAIEGMLQARMADRVPLARRIAWVRDAIADLDAGVAGAPLLGRYLRGLVFAELPPMFDTAELAIADLEASLAARDAFPIDIERGVYRALARAHTTAKRPDEAMAWQRRAGFEADDPPLLGNVSVSPTSGFRFSEARLVREADGIYVAEGFDMANIAFLVAGDGVVVIDAGSTEPGAKAALGAMRAITDAPIRTIILTHAHWDHVGGLAALAGPGTEIIASAGFPEELVRVRAFHPPFHWFFGDGARSFDVTPTRLVAAREPFVVGELSLELIPGPSGETRDALYVHVPNLGLLFVGDAFMPYVGSPFAGEGSPQGYLDAIAFVTELAPRRLVHGHPPLSRYFTIEALPGLGLALHEAMARARAAANEGRSLAELLADNVVPASLRDAPAAAQPYLVMRDHFLTKVHRDLAGHWAGNGEGIDVFTRAEWARAFDRAAGHRPARMARVAERGVAAGDAAMALQLAELGLLEHPEHAGLRRARRHALDALRLRNELLNPFHFIVDSERRGEPVAPVQGPARPTSPPAGLQASAMR